MDKPKRFGEPTPLFDLMDREPTFKKKLEVFQRHRESLSIGQIGLVGAFLLKASDAEKLPNGNQEIADLIGMDALIIGCANHVLRAGTPQEIKDVKDGVRGVNKLSNAIRKRSPMPKEERRYKGSNIRGRQMDRRLRQLERADMWHLLKAGLEGLTSLPLPAEIVVAVRANPKTREFTDERLDRALKWLKDFADAYRNEGQEGGQVASKGQVGDDPSEPGTGSAAA